MKPELIKRRYVPPTNKPYDVPVRLLLINDNDTGEDLLVVERVTAGLFEIGVIVTGIIIGN